MIDLAELIGSSPAIDEIRMQIRRLVARQREGHRLPSILISGETGTGKGLVAHLLHRSSPRAGGPFVSINCAAIPDTLLEAELFGYERGAFTDARQAKAGLFQTAHRGTIFLDEVGLLPAGLQAKLLKALEERAVRRLGGTRVEPFDAWVLSATNADLTVALRERGFREDLYHRLAVLTLHLPPIRERGSDVVMLAEHFLARACADYGLPAKTISPAARALLTAFPWPGNVRQLTNVMERVALLGDAREVAPEMLGLPSAAPSPPGPAVPDRPGTASMEAAMRSHLLDTLEQHRWNISHTAVALGISRNTLRARIEKYGLRQGPRGLRGPRGPAAPRTPPAEPPAPAGLGGPIASSRPVPTPPVEHGPTATSSFVVEPGSTKIRWERRQLVFLRLVLDEPSRGDNRHDTSRLLEVLIDKVRSFGGRIEEFSPTSIGAVFGIEALEEASRRAAHAAMAMQRLVERGRHGEGAGVTAAAGIHAVVLMVGQAGDLQQVDADARRAAWATLDTLVSAGPPGGVMVTAAAAPLLQRRFVLAAPAAPGPDGALQLVGPEHAAIEASGRLTAFVGRGEDLALLESRFHAAVRGQGQVIAISGEAGIGKSRLLHEFRRRIRGHRVTHLDAHCISYGATIPYLPLLQLIRRAFRLDDADAPSATAGKIRHALDRFGVSSADAVPALLEMLGIRTSEDTPGPGPEVIQARIRDTIRELCARASRRRPLVVVVEDLHWIDAASEALGLSLFQGIDTLPILVLLTYRAGYRQPWMDRSYVTQIALPPLSREHSADIVRAVLDADAPAALTELIVDRAEGNPFFLEELAHVIAEQGETREPPVVPGTIQEVLLARINRLPAGARRALETLAVIGRSATHRLLRATWAGPEPIDDLVHDLVRQEFLYERTSPAGETEYVFRHALTQESAYQSLVESTRSRLHGATGEALERLYGGRLEEVVELLAHHFGRSPLDERAVDYGIMAAEKATRRWANIEARTTFTTVLGRLDRMPRSRENLLRRLDAVLKQSEIRFALGEHRAQLQGLAAVGDVVEQVADPARRAAWLYWSGFLHCLVGGQLEVAIARCQEAATLVEGAGLEDLRPFADCCLAQAYSFAGDLREAIAAGERALPEFEARGNVWWACRTMWILSHTANALGDWPRSLGYCARALAHGEAADDLRLKVVALSRTAGTQVQRGDVKTSLASCETALRLGPTPFDTAMVNAVRGYALVKLGDAPGGLRTLREAVEWFGGSHLLYTRSLFSVWLADSLVQSGDREPGRALAATVLATSESVGYRHLQGVAHRVLGESLMPDDRDAAMLHLRQARLILGETGARNELAKTLVAEAVGHAALGDAEEARRLFDEGERIFEALGTVEEPGGLRAAPAGLGGAAPPDVDARYIPPAPS